MDMPPAKAHKRAKKDKKDKKDKKSKQSTSSRGTKRSRDDADSSKEHPTAAAATGGVDDIFASAKDKAARKAARKAEKQAEADALAAIQAARLAALSKTGRAANRLKGEDSPEPLRFDSELGMNIYSVSDLKIGAGAGDTPQCPFDCQCCF